MGNITSNQNDLINKSELNLVDIQELKQVLEPVQFIDIRMN